MVIGLSKVLFRNNQASNLKSAERVTRGQFEITQAPVVQKVDNAIHRKNQITPELCDTKTYYQLIDHTENTITYHNILCWSLQNFA